MFIKEKRKI